MARGRLLEREILDPAAPILKVGGLGDQFQVRDAAPDVYSELVGIHDPRESLPGALPAGGFVEQIFVLSENHAVQSP